jgi:hypothetical protein
MSLLIPSFLSPPPCQWIDSMVPTLCRRPHIVAIAAQEVSQTISVVT